MEFSINQITLNLGCLSVDPVISFNFQSISIIERSALLKTNRLYQDWNPPIFVTQYCGSGQYFRYNN